MLIGYGLNLKTYRCYHCATHKVISSFHVAFIKSHKTSVVHAVPCTPSTSEDVPAVAVLMSDDNPVAQGVPSVPHTVAVNNVPPITMPALLHVNVAPPMHNMPAAPLC